MAIRKSIIMMTNSGTNWNLTGEPVRANAYYGYTDGLHTVQIIYQNFVGGFGLQGTLATNPQPEDWFWIKLNPTGNISNDYLKFPIYPLAPTGNNGGDTGSLAATFVGNFTFLRAVVTRDYLNISNPGNNWNTWSWGQIDKVLLSL